MANEYYRFVRGETPTLDDFRSQGAQGKAMMFPGDEFEVRRWNEGVSVFDDFANACDVAASTRFRRGSYIATIALPVDHDLEVAQTGDNQHHYTIFATAERLLALVVGNPVRIPGAPGA